MFNFRHYKPALFILLSLSWILNCTRVPGTNPWRIDTMAEWQAATDQSESAQIMQDEDTGGEFDLMGNGGLILTKMDTSQLFSRTDTFQPCGSWISEWKNLGRHCSVSVLSTDIIIYGNPLDMTRGWKKFSGNPVLSGGNILLPLNRKNITEETRLLPEPPGGVPQDQSILRGKGIFEGKWVLFFNHTPEKWPKNYYWSLALADSLSPLKQGRNPFTIPARYYPLFGPIDHQAPNDWIEIDNRIYAPDETHQGMSHLWMSDDFIHWKDLGPIRNKRGTDPGICYDGAQFHLFSENGHLISHSRLNIDSVKAFDNRNVLDVKDHTGDADVSFFNNQWHMFVDDGEHLHYKISYAKTDPSRFPYEWELYPEIYGPGNPEDQSWDNDSPEGNDFGTGDADIALEGETLYLFTERPVGAAYKELTEVLDATEQAVSIMLESDSNGDGLPDDSIGWLDIGPGKMDWPLPKILKGKRVRLKIRFSSRNVSESPLIRSVILRSSL